MVNLFRFLRGMVEDYSTFLSYDAFKLTLRLTKYNRHHSVNSFLSFALICFCRMNFYCLLKYYKFFLWKHNIQPFQQSILRVFGGCHAIRLTGWAQKQKSKRLLEGECRLPLLSSNCMCAWATLGAFVIADDIYSTPFQRVATHKFR